MFRDIIITATVLLIIDAMFIASISSFFTNQIELVQKDKFTFDILGGFVAYVFLIFGLYWFIIREKRSLLDAFLLGIVIYGVYEGTTKALFKKWKKETMLIDTIWGGTLFSLTTIIVRKLTVYI